MINTIKNGLKKGLETTFMLSKILIPTYFVITFLKYTPILNFIAKLFEPIMSIFNLPGEAAIVLVLGNTLNIYAAIGAIKAIDLDAYQITTIALMLSFSHSLIVETAIVKKINLKAYQAVSIRLTLAFIAGVGVSMLYKGV
ncbi:nucleoside recognition domain-containing protein [Peptostreptococcaceae bacterium AGR-M142]